MPKKIELYDLGAKKKFKTTNFKLEQKNGRYLVRAKSPFGDHDVTQFIGKELAEKLKGD